MGYSPRGHTELDITETTEHTHEYTIAFSDTFFLCEKNVPLISYLLSDESNSCCLSVRNFVLTEPLETHPVETAQFPDVKTEVQRG